MSKSSRPGISFADFVSAEQAHKELNAAGIEISLSGVYALPSKGVPSHKPPGFGLLFYRPDLLEHIWKSRKEGKARSRGSAKESATANKTKEPKSRGTRPASQSASKPVALGMTGDQLIAAAGQGPSK